MSRPTLLSLWSICFLTAPCIAHEGSHGERGGAAEPASRVKIEVREDYRYIESNGIPDHATGAFPNRGNPNRIAAQRYTYRMPANPRVAERITPVERAIFGVALNGVPFDPGTAEFWQNDPRSGWRFEAMSGKIDLGLDDNHAHVQPSGAYHYHGLPTGLMKRLGASNETMTLVGYAADGFGIYAPYGYTDAEKATSPIKELKSSYRLRKGTRPNGPGGRFDGTFVADWEYVEGAGDLDACNGRFGVTPESKDPTYYYVLTVEFPFIPRSFRGTPDRTFEHARPPGGPRGGPPPGNRPPRRRPPSRGRP